MWARAVWIEDGAEIKDVVPLCWVDENRDRLFWPKEKQSMAMKLQLELEDGWYDFQLVKVKFRSGIIPYFNTFTLAFHLHVSFYRMVHVTFDVCSGIVCLSAPAEKKHRMCHKWQKRTAKSLQYRFCCT